MRVNPNAAVWVERVADFLPILYADDFYEDPDEVRAQALASSFDSSLAMYPGVHSYLRTPEAFAAAETICRLLSQVSGQRLDPADVEIDFSLITTPPDKLLARQKHPHIDPVPLFGLVYLTPGDAGGTCFYFNKRMGTAVIRTPEDRARLDAFHREWGDANAPEGYFVEDNECWQKIYTTEAKFNRLVCYPGSVFHSVDVRNMPENPTPANARLTQRFAIQLPPEDR